MGKCVIPELLAPAGGMKQLKAAVLNGADAIYMGGPLFNARIKAENFTREDMKRAIDYAHERNVRIYVTFNTLIKDSELSRAFEYAAFLYEAGADAVILQDMGLAGLIHKYIPRLDMHLSTQGTVYNRWAAETVKELGFVRVVPARELSLDEIRDLADAFHGGGKSCQVEVFVHGALCMCYSGQCQMSRLLGGANGRSGNRGLCAQPCRLLYRDEKGRGGYWLSPKDICGLDDLPALCEAGVDSLKIEGRLKSPQYVAVVTAIYRKYLDMYRESGGIKVSEEDRQELMQIFNRGGFTGGYLRGNPGRKLLSGVSPKNTGIVAGEVVGVKKGSTLIDIKPSADLKPGDGVEIYGKKVTGNVLSYVKELQNGIVRVGDIKEEVSPGDRVYKVTSKELTKKAEMSYREGAEKRSPVDIIFRGMTGTLPEIVMTEKTTGITAAIKGDVPVQKAVSKPMERDRVASQISKLGDTPFEAVDTEVIIDDDGSMPVSLINSMRRECSGLLLEKKRETGRSPVSEEKIKDICSILEGKPPLAPRRGRSVHLYGDVNLWEILDGTETVYVPLKLFMEGILPEVSANAEIVPYILNVSKGKLDRYIEANFDEIKMRVKPCGIACGNLGWIKRFTEEGITVWSDHGLNIYNRQAAETYESLGVTVRECSYEMDDEATDNLPLMITEHPISSGELTDRKGAKYRVIKNTEGDKYMLFAAGKSYAKRR